MTYVRPILFMLMVLISVQVKPAFTAEMATTAERQAQASQPPKQTGLDEYVSKTDKSYGYKVNNTTEVNNVKLIEAQLESQTWMGNKWQHQLYIAIPNTPRHNSKAMLYIDGGSNKSVGKTDNKSRAYCLWLAKNISAPVVLTRQIPNQPLYNGRYEDSLIAFTFLMYVMDGNPHWPLLLPMVKSAVRAMDAGTKIIAAQSGLKIDGYVVTGVSVRPSTGGIKTPRHSWRG